MPTAKKAAKTKKITSIAPIDPNIVNAEAAKGFFVSMLIKDITLRDAIGDLVDNSVDAIKTKHQGDDLSGFTIEIKMGKSFFSISDNGFGMESKVAREYAFNFGKNDEHKLIDNSIGQFGIGMKRAFFKLGSQINVKSIAATSRFEITIDVPKWLEKPKDWTFEFDKNTLQENVKNKPSLTGLTVHISKLSQDSITSFDNPTFVDTLIKEIQKEHMLNINRGLVIKINGTKLTAKKIDMVNDENIKPTFWQKSSANQSVKILAGISSKDEEEGGWYVFCNDRLILAHNTTEETVWTGKKGDGVSAWHSQYYRFRGYVFFEAKDSANLPWNTTKTGMDMDSPYYKEVRSQMIIMTKQVMGLLDHLKEEKEKGNPEENQKLNKSVERSLKHAQPVLEILQESKKLNSTFHYPVKLFTPPAKGNTVKIAFQVSKEKYEEVRSRLKVTTTTQVGNEVFNYYYENEF